MSIRLDDRARQASAGLHEAIGEAPLLLMERGVPAADKPTVPVWGRPALAGALAAVAVLIGVASLRPVVLAPADDTTPTTVAATTIPTTPPPTTAPTTPPTAVPAPTTPSTSAPPATAPTTTTTVDLEPPLLEILHPADGAVSAERTITFEGRTESGARVMAGPYSAEVRADGTWSIVLVLSEGDNRTRFTATDSAGNTSAAAITVRYELPTPTTTKPEKPVAGFVAHQQYGSCEETPPYDVFYGEGVPGTSVTVSSEYGSGTTAVRADGTWEIRVEFPEAPHGVGFRVKVRDSLDRSRLFEFVSYAG